MTTAIHEAGHAVVAHALGRGVRYVTVTETEDAAGHVALRPRGPGWGQRLDSATYETSYGGFLDARMRHSVEVEIMISFAGMLAQEIFANVRDEAGAGIASMDEATQRRLAEQHGGEPADYERLIVAGDLHEISGLADRVSGSEDEAGAYIDWLEARTRNLLRRPDIETSVRAVADALIERQRLSGSEVHEIIVASVPKLKLGRREQGPKSIFDTEVQS